MSMSESADKELINDNISDKKVLRNWDHKFFHI